MPPVPDPRRPRRARTTAAVEGDRGVWVGILWVRRAKGASHGPLRGSARPAAPRRGWKRGWKRGWNRVESWVEPSILSTAQVMGSLACDEGEAATPAPGAAKRDALEPSLRARFKDMQKIGEGTYGVARQRSKTFSKAWRGEWHRGFWRLVAVLGG